MSEHRKIVKNGRGTILALSETDYISIGKNGDFPMIRCGEKILRFNSFADMFAAIDIEKAIMCQNDKVISK